MESSLRSFDEMKSNFNTCLYHSDKVCAIRYPRGKQCELPMDFISSFGNYDVYGDKCAENVIVTYGRVFSNAAKAVNELNKKINVSFCVLKLNRIKPIDENVIDILREKNKIFVFEESIKSGGVGEKLADLLLENDIHSFFRIFAVNDEFVKAASVQKQLEKYNLDVNGIIREVEKYID